MNKTKKEIKQQGKTRTKTIRKTTKNRIEINAVAKLKKKRNERTGSCRIVKKKRTKRTGSCRIAEEEKKRKDWKLQKPKRKETKRTGGCE